MRISDNRRNVKANKLSHLHQPQNVEIAPVPLELVIAGRVVLNLWRVLRSDLALNIYTFENCSFHILNERVYIYMIYKKAYIFL